MEDSHIAEPVHTRKGVSHYVLDDTHILMSLRNNPGKAQFWIAGRALLLHLRSSLEEQTTSLFSKTLMVIFMIYLWEKSYRGPVRTTQDPLMRAWALQCSLHPLRTSLHLPKLPSLP